MVISLAVMIPSPLASAYVYFCEKNALSGYPTCWRVVVPMVGIGLPASSLPSVISVFLLREPLAVMSQPKVGESKICELSDASIPVLRTAPRFLRMLVTGAPTDDAMLWLISASFDCL